MLAFTIPAAPWEVTPLPLLFFFYETTYFTIILVNVLLIGSRFEIEGLNSRWAGLRSS